MYRHHCLFREANSLLEEHFSDKYPSKFSCQWRLLCSLSCKYFLQHALSLFRSPLGRNYAQIFVRRYCLFREANSFPRMKHEENCELFRNDRVKGQIFELLIHQIFLFALDWSKSVTRSNRAAKTGDTRMIFPNVGSILRVAKDY